ncbi:hypothetical protein BH23GEM9_BH23GEM9_09550 [soil metagenome]
MRRCPTAAILFVSLWLAACDGDLNEPLTDRADLAALLNADGGQLRPHSLPGLLHAAIRKVYTEQGPGAARAVVNDLRRLQEEARSAHDNGARESAAARLEAVRREELAVVLGVFGESIVPTGIAALKTDSARMARALAIPAVTDALLSRTDALLSRGDELRARFHDYLAQAQAAAGSDPYTALDAVTRAAAVLDLLRHVAADERRVRALDELFSEAVEQLRARNGADDGRSSLGAYNEMQRAAQAAVRNGDRQLAQSALESVRGEQIRIVLDVLGSGTVDRLLDDVGYGLAELNVALAGARSGGRDVSRLGRMSASARDMHSRARAALDGGDAVAALDLGSHAAGLINTLRLALD